MIKVEFGHIQLGVYAPKCMKTDDIPIEAKEAEFYADLATIYESLNETIGKESALNVIIRSIEDIYGKELNLK